MSPSVKCCRGDVWTPCPPRGCPSQGDAHLGGKPVPEGCPSQGCPFWGYAQSREKKQTKKASQGMSCMMNSHPGGVPTLVAGLSQKDAHSGGMSIPEDANPSHANRAPANHGAAPHLCHSLSLVVVRPHAWMWDCLWGQWPFLSPLAPALVTPVPSPVLLFPQSQGEPSAPAGSGDGRCSFPVCRLVPPGAAPIARPRRHQPHRPGKFQHRRCCSQGAMVMGAAAVGMDRERRREWLGWRRAQREKEGGLRGGDGRECREGGERWTGSSRRG